MHATDDGYHLLEVIDLVFCILLSLSIIAYGLWVYSRLKIRL